MSNKVFDPNIDYVSRFVSEYSRKYEFLSYEYIDAKFHPKFSDHLVVLGWNNCPKDYKVINLGHSYSFYDIGSLLAQHPDFFKEGLVEAQKVKSKSEEKQEILDELNSSQNLDLGEDKNQDNNQVTIFINETKEDMLKREKTGQDVNDSSSDDYEGGSDEEEKDEVNKLNNPSDHDESSSHNVDSARHMTSGTNTKTNHDVTSNNIDTAVAKDEADDVNFKNDKNGESKSSKQTPEIAQNEELKLDRDNSVSEKVLVEQKSLKESNSVEKKINAFDEEVTQSENSKINDETNPPLEEDKKIDEEDEAQPLIPIPPADPIDEYKSLNNEQKQIFYNYVIDHINDTLNITDSRYHGLEPELAHKDYVIPDSEKLCCINFQSEANETMGGLYETLALDTIRYQPPILRHKYQLSLWKIDQFGMVKVKDRYFTPKEGVKDTDYKDPFNFKMQISLD